MYHSRSLTCVNCDLEDIAVDQGHDTPMRQEQHLNEVLS